MKRILIAVVVLGAISASAFKLPEKATLPNFDRRTDNAAAVPARVAPEHAQAVANLKARVPQLEVTRSKVMNAPNFFSSSGSFLTEADGMGLSVSPATAQAFAQNDPHRAVKAFLDEHAALIGYGAEALNGAEVRREYVAAHNGLRTVIWQQSVENIAVFDAITMGHITRNGELVNLYTEFVRDPNQAAARGLKGRAVAAAAGSTKFSAVEALIMGARNIGDDVTAASLASRGAAQGAARKETFAASGALKGDQYAELVWLPLNANTLRLCWQVVVVSKARGEGFLLVVDAETGEVVLRRGLTHYISDATYNVYTSDSPSPFSPGHFTPSAVQPALVNRQLVVTPALNTNASPNGWIDDGVNETTGNNVDAHTDRNDDDQPDLPRPQGNPNRVFDFPLDLTQAPTTYSAAAIVQLFYWNNFIHDKLWELGFTEAAGNFQVNNFGRGGLGGDAVSADAQDGGGFNNANMLTLPDGIPPRMQMYLFDGPTPDRDGDLDAEIVLHEYTHGLSNRRVGGGVGIFQLQTGGMGEGWSDFYGLSLLAESTDALNGNWAAGGYATFNFFGLQENYYYGIRRYPYSTNLSKNPLTFKDIDPTKASAHPGIPRNPIFGPFTPFDAAEVHNQGEVWCVTLWELRANFITKYGFATGNQLALQLVTDAMSLCPPNPNFLQSRDAILLADRINNSNANYNEIWRAFAKRGMGSSATAPDSSTTQGVFESFDFPGLSLTTVAAADGSTGNGNGAIDPNECVEIFVSLRNNSVASAVSISGVLTTTTPGVTIVQGSSAYPNLLPNAAAQNLTPFRIYTSPDFVCGTRIQLSLIATGFAPDRQVTTNTFQLRSGFVSLNPVLLNNNTPVNIPDANTNGAQSTINVSGMTGALGKLTVSLHITHPFVGDLLLELIGPDGTTIALSKNQGAFGDNYGISCTPFSSRTTFDDNAQLPISVGNAPYVGTFRPDEPLDVFEGKSGAALNGTWRLRVVDSGPLDVGTLQCWTLALFPTVCADGGGPCTSDVGVSGTVSPIPALSNRDLTYTMAVTNHRPIAAAAVVLTNVLPANVSFVSASSSQGSCSFSGGVVSCNFGALANGVNASATIIVQSTATGTLTNLFAVGAAGPDANPANNIARIITTISEPSATIVAAGLQITDEQAPPTGGIEAGETVTVNLALRNIGSAATANLMAALQEGNGVSAAGGPRNYGAIAIGATATQPFTFTASGAAGSTASAVLSLQDGVQNLGTVSFNFTIGGDMAFENGAAITINALGTASPYPSTINVTGAAGVISKVRVTLTKLSHSFPDDIDALLVGPRGQKLVLMSDSGGGTAIVNRTLTFDASAGSPLPDEGTISAGNYQPTDYVSGTEPAGDVFPAPAPAGSLSSSLLAFNSTDPNGAWSLYIHDDGGGDGGAVSGGWALAISTAVPINSAANLSIAAAASPSPAIVGETLAYALTVANSGPSNATSVIVSDTIPANSSFASASSSQGSVSFAAGVLTANLGTINSGATATVTVRVTPTASGPVANQANVSAATADLDLSNNSVSTVITANNPVADLAVLATATPQPAFVSSNVTLVAVITNRGPNHADAVRLTGNLSSALAFVSATNTQGTCSSLDGVVTCDFGSLPVNGSARVTIVATALSAVSATNLFTLSSTTTDSSAGNNATNVVIGISPLAPFVVGAGSALLAESFSPANSAIEPGEVVSLNLGLRNIGTANTTDLIATLLASGGVTSPSGAQSYGVVAANGAVVSRPFQFLVSGGAGETLTVTLQLADGAQQLGTASFTFTLSANTSFPNGNVILIPNQGSAGIYPSTLAVSGLTGAVSKVTVTLNQLTHSFPDDLDILLVGPSGQKVMLMSDVGAGIAVTDVTLTFDDSAAPIGSTTALVNGTYYPTDLVGADSDTLPAPAPGKPYSAGLSIFNGTNPNGTWSLYVVDDTAGDSGRINGWTLNVQMATPVIPSADLSVSAVAPASSDSGAPMTYVFTVANSGPAAANAVVLTDALPAGFVIGSVTVSQGSFSTGSGTITANIGSLASGGTATVTVNGAAVGPRTLTNVVSVTAAQSDLNPANNVATSITEVSSLRLSVRRVDASVLILWPAPSNGYVLETSGNASGPWATAGVSITVSNGFNRATVTPSGTAFYRLRKP
jgi:uncharacterized repeat protein (TIGR01451 family)